VIRRFDPLFEMFPEMTPPTPFVAINVPPTVPATNGMGGVIVKLLVPTVVESMVKDTFPVPLTMSPEPPFATMYVPDNPVIDPGVIPATGVNPLGVKNCPDTL
jgi:hypothetical protein